ncbi:hypothetical protein AVEN_209210-1, partial [Araneus ventricosus]
ISTSRFEATLGLFWDGPLNCESRSDDEAPELAPLSLNSRTTPEEERSTCYISFVLRELSTLLIRSGEFSAIKAQASSDIALLL